MSHRSINYTATTELGNLAKDIILNLETLGKTGVMLYKTYYLPIFWHMEQKFGHELRKI